MERSLSTLNERYATALRLRLLEDRDLRFNLEQALQVLDGDVALDFHAVENVLLGQVLDEKRHGACLYALCGE